MTRRPGRSVTEFEAAMTARGDVPAVTVGRRTLVAGTIITVKGERGEFEFRSARVVDGECQWLQVVGGTASHRAWRYFTPDRIKAVKRINRQECAE